VSPQAIDELTARMWSRVTEWPGQQVDTIHPAAGLSSGFVDNFVLEKLLGGSRLNHFIGGRLGPFVNG
jgi:hypothetical protein